VPWIFGIMHPTGFPVFTMLGGTFAHAVPLGEVSARMALFSALCGSGAAWLLYRTCVLLECDDRIGLGCAWIFAFGEIAWTRSTRAEVHTLALFFAMLALYAAVKWYRTGNRRLLAAGAGAWGLGIATHPICALLLPAFLVLLPARMRRTPLRAVLAAAFALACAVALYGYLPVRSALVTQHRLDPTRALGLPAGRAFWDLNHPSTWKGFRREVTGEEFSAQGALRAMVDARTYRAQTAWFAQTLLREITPLCALVILVGLYALARTDAALAGALALAFAVPAAFAMAFTVEADRERYCLLSFAVGLVLTAYGASAIARYAPPARAVAGGTLFVVAIAFLWVHRDIFEQPQSSGARDVIATVVQKTPDNAVLIAPWLFATPLAYAAYVDRTLGHRTLDCAWLADDAAYIPAWTHTRPVFVVGKLFGSVPGYHTVVVPGAVDLYRVVKN